MKRFKKRTFVLVLTLLLILVNIPMSVFAEADDVEFDLTRVPDESEPIAEENLEEITIDTSNTNPGLSIVTTANKTEVWPGETIRYTFVVTNTGNVKVYDVDVDDSIEPGGPSNTRDIDVGASKTYTRDYVVPNGTRGVINNDGWADGWYWSWHQWKWLPVASNHHSVDVTVKWPDISLEKTVSTTEAFYGESIEYTFTIENTGTVPLHNVLLSDEALDYRFEWPELAAGAIVEKKVSYTIPCKVPDIIPSDTDVKKDDSSFTNCADVIGYLEPQEQEGDVDIDCIRPEKPPGSVTDTSCVTVNLKVESLGLQLTKRVYDEEIGNQPVEVLLTPEPQKSCLLIDNNQEFVYYYFDLYNSGNAPLHDIVINDNQIGDPIILDEFMKEEVILQPGQSITVGPVAFDVGEVTEWPLVNVATATGDGYCHDITSNESSTCVNLASILLDKTVNPTSALVGDVVSYTLKITNIGSVDLYNIELSDNKIAYSTIVPELKAGFTTTFIVPYTVKSEDVGEFVNVASVNASTCNHQETSGQVIDYVPCMEVGDTDDAVLTVTTPAIPPINPPEREEREPRQVVVVPPVEVPLAAPATETPTEPEVVPEEVVPLAPVVLPKTGELPATLFYGIGGLLSALGVFLKRR